MKQRFVLVLLICSLLNSIKIKVDPDSIFYDNPELNCVNCSCVLEKDQCLDRLPKNCGWCTTNKICFDSTQFKSNQCKLEDILVKVNGILEKANDYLLHIETSSRIIEDDSNFAHITIVAS